MSDKLAALGITLPKLFGMLSGLCGVLIIVYYCAIAHDTNLSLLALFGGSLGWLTGILVAPLSKEEQRQFSDYAKVISGFVTGYLLSKVDPLITALLKVNELGLPRLIEPRVATLVLITLCSYFVALLLVFCARAYWSKRPDKAETNEVSDTVTVETTKTARGAPVY